MSTTQYKLIQRVCAKFGPCDSLFVHFCRTMFGIVSLTKFNYAKLCLDIILTSKWRGVIKKYLQSQHITSVCLPISCIKNVDLLMLADFYSMLSGRIRLVFENRTQSRPVAPASSPLGYDSYVNARILHITQHRIVIKACRNRSGCFHGEKWKNCNVIKCWI